MRAETELVTPVSPRRTSNLAVGRRQWIVVVLVAAIGAAGALVVGGERGQLVALAVFVPLAVWIVVRTPLVAVGLLPAVQAMDWIRVDTALASMSPRTVLVGLLALTRAGRFVQMLRERTDLVFVTLALALWWGLSLVRSSHSVFDESPARGLVTTGTFVAIVIIGITFADDFRAIRNIAFGAAAALLVIGAASMLVSFGWIAEPDRVSPGWEILGFESPFSRNYGFDLTYDAVALLVPLCIPYFLWALLSVRDWPRARIEAALVIALLAIVFALLVQSRGMAAQVFLAAVLMCALTQRYVLAGVGAAAVVVAGAVAVVGTVGSRELSSSFRIESNLEALAAATSSFRVLLVGTDEQTVIEAVLRDPALANAVGRFEDIPIHNLFLSNLVTGGVASLLLLASLVVLAGVRLVRSDWAQPAPRVLLVAFVLVLMEMNLEPIRANVIGAWLVLGLILGLAARREAAITSGPLDQPGSDPRERAHSAA